LPRGGPLPRAGRPRTRPGGRDRRRRRRAPARGGRRRPRLPQRRARDPRHRRRPARAAGPRRRAAPALRAIVERRAAPRLPPGRRQVRDGVLLLQELGALDGEQRLTKLGRRLARLPVDPRLGRMVLEADRLGCADEVIVIAAGLSIQDPRERPAERREAADQQHARFADPRSDFLAYLNLWRHLEAEQRRLSGNQFRKRCHAEFLHHLRVREWQDLVGQLREAAKEVGIRRNRTAAEPDHVHTALLSGLLSHIGLKDPRGREYQGARNARFAIFPASSLAAKPPAWVMVAELVETTRLWGRISARIQPQSIEP